MKKILDSIVRFVLSLNETKRNETKRNEQYYAQKWKEVQLFSNCTSIRRKESEGLNLCSLFNLKNRGAFLC